MKLLYSAKHSGLFLCILAAWQLQAQKTHLPDKDQIELAKEQAPFCKPGVVNQSPGRGVLFQYSNVGSHGIFAENGLPDGFNSSRVSHVDQLTAKVKIPLANTPGLKVLLGYEYAAETYHFSRIGAFQRELFQSLDGNPLRNNKYSLYLTKSFNSKYYAGLRLRTSYRGDYDQGMTFEGRYAAHSALAVFGIKARPDLDWGIGLTYSDNFFNRQLLPFAFYNRTFNDKWGIEAVLPVSVMGRYNFREGRLLLFGAEYQSDSYAIDVLAGRSGHYAPYYFRHSEIAVKASYDHHLFSWVWFNVEGGYQVPVRNQFIPAEVGATINNKPEGQPFLRIGLFVSPSKDCIQ